ncbi:MAG: hypothetical protein R6W68_11140 [Ignavibacteriaceae bacterium]
MKASHIFWGTLFVVLGGLGLIANFLDINFEWSTAWKFWPLVLVLIGLSIIVKNKTGKLLISGLAGLVLALSIFASISSGLNFFKGGFNFNFDDGPITSETSRYTEPFNDSIKSATFNFNAGAGNFRLLTTTDELLDISTESYGVDYTLIRNDYDDISNLTFKMESKKFRFGKKGSFNKVEIALNPEPVWDINFDVGAASMKVDLSSFKVSEIDINMGAAALNLKIGEPVDETRLDIDAGASDIDIFIPEAVGCEIISDVALSATNYEGFTKLESSKYRTPNFDESVKKIFIKIESGVSSIDVRKY